MIDHSTDRLWTRPATLTDDERERARLAFEQTPTLLDGPVLAALGHLETVEAQAARMLALLRGGERCSDS